MTFGKFFPSVIFACINAGTAAVFVGSDDGFTRFIGGVIAMLVLLAVLVVAKDIP